MQLPVVVFAFHLSLKWLSARITIVFDLELDTCCNGC